jgi:DNA-binding transcriptional ArsR family regulator
MGAATALDDTLRALADPTRRQVIELLVTRPHRATALADALQMSPPAMSRHLRVLRTQGLIEERHPPEDARVRVYRLRPERFVELSAWLGEIEGLWNAQLASLASHLGAAPGGDAR